MVVRNHAGDRDPLARHRAATDPGSPFRGMPAAQLEGYRKRPVLPIVVMRPFLGSQRSDATHHHTSSEAGRTA